MWEWFFFLFKYFLVCFIFFIYFIISFYIFLLVIADVRFLRVVDNQQNQLEIVLACHRGAGDSDEAVSLGGHVGRDKVIDCIMQRYWRRNITADVTETIKTCVRCQKANTVFKKVDSKLHIIPIKPKIMHQIGVDLCGPMWTWVIDMITGIDVSTVSYLH